MKLPFLFSLLILLLFAACGNPMPQNPYPADKRFQTSAPNKLLFNNLRSTQYVQEENTEHRIHRYFHKKWFSERENDGLGLVIVDNWLFDQAYLEVVRIDAPTEPISLPLVIQPGQEDQNPLLQLTDHGWINQLEFSQNWSNALAQTDSLFFRTQKGEWLPVFPLSSNQQYFKQVISDYEQLVQ